MQTDFVKNLSNIVRDLEGELKQIEKINSREFRSMKAYAMSGHAITIRQVIRPLKGKEIDELYSRMEAITAKASTLIVD